MLRAVTAVPRKNTGQRMRPRLTPALSMASNSLDCESRPRQYRSASSKAMGKIRMATEGNCPP